MSNQTHTLFQPGGLVPRVVLHCLMLIAAALFPGTAPRLGLLALTESEEPLDEREPSEGAAISIEARTQLRRHQPHSLLLVAVHGKPRFMAVDDCSRAHPCGHRLPNHLMAPLRC